jgi:hypothetical protein
MGNCCGYHIWTLVLSKKSRSLCYWYERTGEKREEGGRMVKKIGEVGGRMSLKRRRRKELNVPLNNSWRKKRRGLINI